MEIFIYILQLTVDLAVSAVMLAMFVRAILSILPFDDEGAVSSFLTMVTEPVIYPVRLIFDKLGIGGGIPFDIPFLVTYFILLLISMLI